MVAGVMGGTGIPVPGIMARPSVPVTAARPGGPGGGGVEPALEELPMMLPSVDALAAMVPDGALLAMPPDNSLPSVALAKALIRKGARNLRLLGVPVSGFATDILIGAGCVAEVETSAVSLGEAGFAPRFSAALKDGPACGTGPAAFDADLMRVRALRITLRVQAGQASYRGLSPRWFRRPGLVTDPRLVVPDQEATFDVAPPNLRGLP
jgi:hypothetical protein